MCAFEQHWLGWGEAMQRSILATHRVLLLVWVLALGFVPVYVRFDHAGWDMNAYAEAKREMAAGNDPYLEGMRAQRQFYGTPSSARPRETPLPYLYPPITLPLLRALGGLGLPFWFWACGYCVVYGAGVLVQMYVGLQGAEQEERAGFLMLAAVLIYFPGLLKHDNLLGGNISFIVYGLVLAAALAGWRRGRWEWFYLMVFAASCFKLPWLTLLAIPILSA